MIISKIYYQNPSTTSSCILVALGSQHSSSQQRLYQQFYVLTLNFEIPQVAYFYFLTFQCGHQGIFLKYFFAHENIAPRTPPLGTGLVWIFFSAAPAAPKRPKIEKSYWKCVSRHICSLNCGSQQLSYFQEAVQRSQQYKYQDSKHFWYIRILPGFFGQKMSVR